MDPVGGSRGHVTFRSKVLAQENVQWGSSLPMGWASGVGCLSLGPPLHRGDWVGSTLQRQNGEKLTETLRIAAGRKQTLSECPLPCCCWDDSNGDVDSDNGEEGKNDHKGYIYRTTPPLLPAGGWTTVSHFTVEGPRKSIDVGVLHGQGQSHVTLVCNFFHVLRPLVIMLPLEPLASFPEAEDPLTSVLRSSYQFNPFMSLLSPPHHMAVSSP